MVCRTFYLQALLKALIVLQLVWLLNVLAIIIWNLGLMRPLLHLSLVNCANNTSGSDNKIRAYFMNLISLYTINI